LAKEPGTLPNKTEICFTAIKAILICETPILMKLRYNKRSAVISVS
jgi:hypothetical protein